MEFSEFRGFLLASIRGFLSFFFYIYNNFFIM